MSKFLQMFPETIMPSQVLVHIVAQFAFIPHLKDKAEGPSFPQGLLLTQLSFADKISPFLRSNVYTPF